MDLPNDHISALFLALSNLIDAPLDDPKSELDYHANMIVLGKHCFVFEWYGKSCTVNTFDNCLGSVKDLPIIDSDIAYDCPYYYECYLLLCCNALYLTNTTASESP